MNIKLILIVLLALLLGLGAGYIFRHNPWSNSESINIEQGNFEDIYADQHARVVLYSLSTCPVCAEMRQLLQENGVRFVERVIDKSDAASREAKNLDIKMVPVLFIENYKIQGFNKESIVEILNRRNISTTPKSGGT